MWIQAHGQVLGGEEIVSHHFLLSVFLNSTLIHAGYFSGWRELIENFVVHFSHTSSATALDKSLQRLLGFGRVWWDLLCSAWEID